MRQDLLFALQAAAEAAERAPHQTTLTVTIEGVVVLAQRGDIEYRQVVQWRDLDADPEWLDAAVRHTNSWVTGAVARATPGFNVAPPIPVQRGSFAKMDAFATVTAKPTNWPFISAPPLPGAKPSWPWALASALKRVAKK